MTVLVTWKTADLKLNPCILVTERLTVERGVSYDKRDVSVVPHMDGSEDATWETQRHYKNKEEAKEADRVYSNARFRIRSKCLYTEVGYLCPEKDKALLETSIQEAKDLVDEFNKKAQHCHVKFRVLCTSVQPGNIDGTEALRETLERNTVALKDALSEFDVKRARNMLVATKPALDLLSDGRVRKTLESVRGEARELANQIAEIIRQCGDNVDQALESVVGKSLAERVGSWDFI